MSYHGFFSQFALFFPFLKLRSCYRIEAWPPPNLVGWVDVVDVRELVLFSDARRC